MKLEIQYVCSSHMGKIRGNNEDNFICLTRYMNHENTGTTEPISGSFLPTKPYLLGVFDGMGGEELGEMASFLAADTAARFAFRGDPTDALKQFCKKANERIYRYAEDNNIISMGSTAAMILFDENAIHICNIGDSRIYQFSENKMKQVSVDHVMPMQGKKKPPLSQNLGIPEEELDIEPYIGVTEYREGDVFLICSDGLTDMVSEEKISAILGATEPYQAVNSLQEEALINGGRDNITILVCLVKKRPSPIMRLFNRLTGGRYDNT